MEKIVYGRRRVLLAAFALMVLLCACAATASAQDASPGATGQELKVSDILRMPGKVLGEGAAARGVGRYRLAGFRLEQVDLPSAQRVEVAGRAAEVSQAFRLTLTGGPFPVRALPPVVWVDDVAVGYGVENEDLNEITVVFFDRAPVREGASLYLSYGSKEDKTDRERVPQTLNLGGAKGGNQ